jgi:uncharacterized protein with FMN-binding domain
MLQTHEQKSKIRLATTVIAVLVIAGIVILADHLKSRENTTATLNTASTTSSSTDTSASSSTTSGTIKDGTYSATSSYSVPHGNEEIQVSVTLKDGVVTDASVQNSESDFDSKQYQEEFTAGYKTKVIGKKISGLQISVIAGASDTTEGFNEALSQIISKAEA